MLLRGECLGRRTGSLWLGVAGSGVREVKAVSGSRWGGRVEKKAEYLQRKRDGRDSLRGTTDRSVDRQHRTTFCTLKHVRSSYKPAMFMDSGFLVDASSGVLEKEDWALAVGRGRVRGVYTGSSSMVVMVVVCGGKGWRR